MCIIVQFFKQDAPIHFLEINFTYTFWVYFHHSWYGKYIFLCAFFFSFFFWSVLQLVFFLAFLLLPLSNEQNISRCEWKRKAEKEDKDPQLRVGGAGHDPRAALPWQSRPRTEGLTPVDLSIAHHYFL